MQVWERQYRETAEAILDIYMRFVISYARPVRPYADKQSSSCSNFCSFTWLESLLALEAVGLDGYSPSAGLSAMKCPSSSDRSRCVAMYPQSTSPRSDLVHSHASVYRLFDM